MHELSFRILLPVQGLLPSQLQVRQGEPSIPATSAAEPSNVPGPESPTYRSYLEAALGNDCAGSRLTDTFPLLLCLSGRALLLPWTLMLFPSHLSSSWRVRCSETLANNASVNQ